jgi:isocitrate/isopropylmalate dehydrogenase
MQIELTNREIWESQQAINQLINLRPAPTVEVAFKLARNARKIQQAVRDIVTVREQIREQYIGTVTGDDGEERDGVLPEHREQWDADLDELLDQPTEVDLRIITVDELQACEDRNAEFGLPPALIFAASFMFELDSPEGTDDEPTE